MKWSITFDVSDVLLSTKFFTLRRSEKVPKNRLEFLSSSLYDKIDAKESLGNVFGKLIVFVRTNVMRNRILATLFWEKEQKWGTCCLP
jgi:hypothetical protein